MEIDRRLFIAAGAAGVVAPGVARGAVAESPLLASLSAFAAPWLAARNAPGMIVAMADASGWHETARYGLADVEARRPIGPAERFHIGSISKSFAALMIMQLVDEGKVKLDADVRDYLPHLPLKAPLGPVTIHHLLCHGAGIPGDAPPAGWPDPTVEQVNAPGTHFHYSNLGYEWLGQVVEARGGETWAAALRRRVLDPLGMTETSPQIGAGMRHLEVPSYVRREDDRPYPLSGALVRGPRLTFPAASGCVASTAGDMAKYIIMLLHRGVGPRGRLLSPESFARMTSRQIAAAEFGPGGGYGYGWMTGALEGKPVIRHTGGMVSFMSSIHIDLDAGFGAFASINAQQNYRPVPVTGQALRLYRAAKAKAPPPKAPPVDPDAGLTAADYVGDYHHADGRKISVAAAAGGLRMVVDGKVHRLEGVGNDAFVCREPAWRLFTMLFTRAVPPDEAAPDKPNPVRALSWARDSYVRTGASLPPVPVPDSVPLTAEQLRGYEGLYGVEAGGWLTAARVVARDGRLWVDSFDGIAPLAHLGDDRFHPADAPDNPEIVAFSPATVAPRTLASGGTVLARLGDPFFELL